MKCITLKNKYSTEVTLSSLGASILDIKTLDYKNELGSIVIVPKDKEKFYTSTSYFGKTIGRTGGRITNGKFALNGKQYQIISNDKNGLHGGNDGLSYKDFDTFESESNEAYLCEFKYFSKDLESGYPGNLKVSVLYKLYKNENKLDIVYNGECDQDTLLNLSNHSYFNLNANSGKGILDHTLYINASKMEKLENMIPKGIYNCEEKYSFKKPHKIGDYLFDKEIIDSANGYDFPYIFDDNNGNKIELYDDVSKRKLIVNTTYPVVVVYTCNYCDDLIINNDRKIKPYDAVCLECMYHPNTINSDFLSEKKDVLKKGKIYNEVISFSFE